MKLTIMNYAQLLQIVIIVLLTQDVDGVEDQENVIQETPNTLLVHNHVLTDGFTEKEPVQTKLEQELFQILLQK